MLPLIARKIVAAVVKAHQIYAGWNKPPRFERWSLAIAVIALVASRAAQAKRLTTLGERLDHRDVPAQIRIVLPIGVVVVAELIVHATIDRDVDVAM